MKIIKVPHFLELSSTRVYVLALGDRRIREYLPDYEHEKPINRQYLFNVSALELPTSLCRVEVRGVRAGSLTLIDCQLLGPRLLRGKHPRGLQCPQAGPRRAAPEDG